MDSSSLQPIFSSSLLQTLTLNTPFFPRLTDMCNVAQILGAEVILGQKYEILQNNSYPAVYSKHDQIVIRFSS